MVAIDENQRKTMPVTRIQRTLLCCAMAGILSEPALANNEDVIARCAAIAVVGDRILCLEDALRQAPPAPETMPEVVAAPVASPPEVVSPVTVGVVDVVSDAVTATAPPVVESVEREVASDVQHADKVAATIIEPKELGAEQVSPGEDVGRNADRISARIVSFDVVGVGSLRFWLDNGQVWRQIGNDDQNIRRKIRKMEDIPVEMWQSRTGGYRMRIVSIDRTVRVKRLK